MDMHGAKCKAVWPDGPSFAWWTGQLCGDGSPGLDADALVQRCLAYIWGNVHRPIDVNAIVRVVPATRRTMERKFRASLGRSIHEVVASARLSLALWWLAKTDLPIAEIAMRSGYSGSDWMGKSVKRTSGLTPTEYRRRSRRDGVAAGIYESQER